jgi:hypothetical protein
MQVIARIPEVRAPGEPPATAPRDGARPARPPEPVRPAQPRRPARTRPARPSRAAAALRFVAADLQSWTVAGLAALALVAWGLVSWQEAGGAHRQRQPARIAAQPPSLAAPSRAFGP